jgi:hypothetical protein
MSFAFRARLHPRSTRRAALGRRPWPASFSSFAGGSKCNRHGPFLATSDDRRRSPLVISTNAALARTDAAAIVRGAGSNPGDA